MANDRLKIDDTELANQVTQIKNAVEHYKCFGDKPFVDEIENLENMNTDFIAKYKVMLEDLNDGNSKVIKALDEIANLTDEILKTFTRIDDEAVASMGFTREG